MSGQTAMDNALLVDCVTVLQKHYPGHFWHAMMYSDKSAVAIRCLNVSSQLGYVLHTYRIQGDPERKCVVKAGGELLERANLRRGLCTQDSEGFTTENSANVLDKKYQNKKALSPVII